MNRKTIVIAFEDLIAEGWLSTTYKKGTFISEKLPATNITYRQAKDKPIHANFSYRNLSSAGDPFIQKKKNTIVFDDGLPDVRLAPMNELARAYKRIFQQNTRWRMMGYGNPKGTEMIRAAISNMLLHDRGLAAVKENILVTRGSQMALYLTANTIIEKGDRIAIEDPGYSPAWNTFVQCGAKLVPIKVDPEGICVSFISPLKV